MFRIVKCILKLVEWRKDENDFFDFFTFYAEFVIFTN